MILSELVSVIGFKVDQKSLDNVNKTLDKLKKGLIAVGGMLAVGKGIQILKNVSDELEDINNKSKELNISTDAMQELQHAFERTGLSSDAASAAIGTMTRRLSPARLKTYGQHLTALGLKYEDLKDLSPDEVFKKISDGVANAKDHSVALNAASQVLGTSLGQKLMPLLKSGSEGFENLAKEAHEAGLIISSEDIEINAKLTAQTDRLNNAWKAFRLNLAIRFLPTFERVLGKFMDFYDRNRALIDQGLDKTVELLTTSFETMVDYVDDLIKGIENLNKTFEEWKDTLIDIIVLLGIIATTYGIVWVWKYAATWRLLLGMSFANFLTGMKAMQVTMASLGLTSVKALAAYTVAVTKAGIATFWALAKPFLAIGAVVLFVIGLINDVWMWATGGKSALGEMLGPIEEMWPVFRAIAAIVIVIGAAFLTWPVILAIMIPAMIAAFILFFDDIKYAFTNMGKEVATFSYQLFWLLGNSIKNIFFVIIDAIKNAFISMISGVTSGIDNAINFAKKIPGVSLALKTAGKGANAVAKVIGGGAANPSIDGQAKIDRTENNRPQQANFTVQGIQVDARGMNPEDATKAVQDGTEAALRQANEDFQGGK